MHESQSRADADTVWRRALALYSTSDLAGAEALAQTLVQEVPNHVEALNMLGVIALRTGRIDRSVALLQDAVMVDPTVALTHFHLGHALFRGRLYEEAANSFETAIELDPHHANARRALTKVFLYRVFTNAFVRSHGRTPNIASPETFNDRILHRIIHDRDPRLNIICDKIAVRDFIANRVDASFLTPVIGSWEQPEDIPWAELPDNFVLKSSHGSGQCVLVRDKANFDLEALVETSRAWLALDYGKKKLEWAYVGLPRRLIIEPLLEAPDGGDLLEPQVFTVDGRAALIFIVTGAKAPGERRGAWFTVEGRRLDVQTITVRNADVGLSEAERLTIVAAAEQVAKEFSSMRVDFYLTRDGLRIGELTPYNQGGRAVWVPPERDAQLGRLWRGDFDLSFLPDFVAQTSEFN